MGQAQTKVSAEQTMKGRMLYSPKALNAAFKAAFIARGWASKKIVCEYTSEYYTDDYKQRLQRLPQPLQPKRKTSTPFREMDFVKDQLGVEVQFGKYAFMVYNVCQDDDFS